MPGDGPYSPVSFMAHVARLPAKGMPVVIEANAAQRDELAQVHGLQSVERYRAELLVTPWKRNGVKVTGTVDADVTQICVVTLEPIEARVAAEVEGLFLPENSKLGRAGINVAGEIMIDFDGPDGPETFAGDTIDVGAFAEEFFGLALDPYPRKATASLATDVVETTKDEPDGPLHQKLRALLPKS